MLKLRKISASHRDVFIQRYDRLLTWALQLTDHDRALAEDLLHDAFILFTLGQPDLDSIVNVESYLFTVLRNLHLSQMRRATRSRFQQLSIVEYDSAEIGLEILDPRAQMQVHGELRRVCHYACVRKETSKAGSVLILRFFHGYYPSEIVRVLRRTRKAVDDRLRVARSEAKLSIENPGALSFMRSKPIPDILPASHARSPSDLLSELRETIFQSRLGACFSREQIEKIYQRPDAAPMNTESLAHLVSCRICLDEVSALLKLPLLSERYPVDMIGKDTPPRDRSGGGPTGGIGGGGGRTGGGGLPQTSASKWERDARETFEHKPEELCVAVNGYLLGSQKVGLERNELTLSAKDEQIDFVEVFSEQGIRLFLFNVSQPPPEGPGEQSVRVSLSDARALELTVKFISPWPTLHLLYHDPALRAEPAVSDGASQGVTEGVRESIKKMSPLDRLPDRLANRLKDSLRRTWQRLADSGLWIRPATVTALLAIMIAAAFLLFRSNAPVAPPAAADLLRQSTRQEEALSARVDQVLHRTINLEERQVDCQLPIADCRFSNANKLISSRKIDVWESAEKGIVARRLYDEQGKLLAGDWRRSDGVQTLFHHGAQPKLKLAPEKLGGSRLSFDSVWQLSPSAKEFAQVIGNSSGTRVEEQPGRYVITVESSDSASSAKTSATSVVKKAVLILNRTDLHALEQTLLIAQGSETREYKFTELAFEQKSLDTVPPKVFDPDSELLSSATPSSKPTEPTKEESPSPDSTAVAPVRAVASSELEVEVLRLLNQAGADMGEQINVTRTPEGQLQVLGVVETVERKRELIHALDSVRNNPAVKIQINSVAEAVQRQPETARPSSSVVIERSESTANVFPVEPELRRYFAGKGLSEEQAAANARRFANRTLDESSRALQHAWALKRLAERFSPDDLRRLSPEARDNWLALIREHARALQQINAGMRQELQPIFFPSFTSDNADSGIEIRDDADLIRATERLLGICTSNDRAVSAAFTLSSGLSSASAISTQQFSRSLKSVEVLAERIAQGR